MRHRIYNQPKNRMAPFRFQDGGLSLVPASASHLWSERNDCVVRALANATGLTYEDAHDLVKWHGRRNGKATYRTDELLDSLFPGMRIFSIKAFRHDPLMMACPTTLGQFIIRHPTGRFVCLKRGHAFAVVNGVVLDRQAIGKATKLTYATEIE
jgi:hypothetical protein